MFKKGDRVRLSPEYWQHFKRTAQMKDRIGTVSGIARNDSAVRVRWDGNAPSTIEYYHKDFVMYAHEAMDCVI